MELLLKCLEMPVGFDGCQNADHRKGILTYGKRSYMVVRVTYVSSDSLTYGKRSYMVVRVTYVVSDSLTPILSSSLVTNHGSSCH